MLCCGTLGLFAFILRTGELLCQTSELSELGFVAFHRMFALYAIPPSSSPSHGIDGTAESVRLVKGSHECASCV